MLVVWRKRIWIWQVNLMAKILDFRTFNNMDDLEISDRQTIDAVELLIEYMAEVGCDLDSVVNSRELGDQVTVEMTPYDLSKGRITFRGKKRG